MVTCPTCGCDDLELVQRLEGDARILRCLRCGHQWQRGEVPKRAEPGRTKEQRLRALFPTIEDLSPKRFQALGELINDPHLPKWSDHQSAFRDRYQELFSSKASLARMDVEDFKHFFVSDELANVGPARFAAETTLKELGPDEFIEKVREALEYLLFEEGRSLEQRVTDLVDGRSSPAVKGVREAILTKVMAAAMPDRIFPALVYDSEDGSGKRQVADAIFGLELPARDRTNWTIGRLVIWSNDLFVDIAHHLGFQDLHPAADFIWGLWKRHQDGDQLFPAGVAIEEFVEDDEGYLRWVRRHPRGLVLNCEKTPRAEYLVLHLATCATISGNPARGDTWTKDYMKVCGTDRQAVVSWAESRTGARPSPCGICFGR